MTSTITLNAAFDMAAFDFDDILNGTVTSSSSTEVDVTGHSGTHHYVFTGTGFSDFTLNNGLPFVGAITGFTIDDTVTVSGIQEGFVALGDNRWGGDGIGVDTVTGSGGGDVLQVNSHGHGIGNAGNDTLDALGGDVTLSGGAGDDVINGYTNPGSEDTVASYSDAAHGVRVLLSVTGSQNVGGGMGHDTLNTINNLTGSAFDDRLSGNDQANIIDGGGGHDTLSGGAGDDLLIAHDVTDPINGGTGFDTAQYVLPAGMTLNVASLTSVEAVIGTDFNDTITASIKGSTLNGAGGDDTLDGNNRADVLIGGTGDDVLNGGGGYDTADYSASTNRVAVDLTITGPQLVSSRLGNDTLISVENLTGSNFNDVLTGNDHLNFLSGLGGKDTLDGGLGNDTIDGGRGQDTMTGGSGHDIFQYDISQGDEAVDYSGAKAPDLITDFDSTQDKFHFTVAGVTYTPDSIGVITTGALDSSDYKHDFDTAVGTVAAHSAVLFTPDSGDFAGNTYLVVNLNGVAQSNVGLDVVIQLGGNHFAGLDAGDFI